MDDNRIRCPYFIQNLEDGDVLMKVDWCGSNYEHAKELAKRKHNATLYNRGSYFQVTWDEVWDGWTYNEVMNAHYEAKAEADYYYEMYGVDIA